MILHSSVRGEGEPLILLHGLFGMGSNLSMVAKSLSEYFRVYSLDLRNHGQSFRANSMAFTDMADDVLQFMNDTDLERVHILGHSLGGKVAMQVALSHAQRVERLIVADIAPVAYNGHHEAIFAGLQAIDVDTVTSRSVAEQVLTQYVSEPEVRSFLLKNLYRTEQGSYAWRLNVQVLYACYAQMREAIQTTSVFTEPTLFIKAEHSNYILPEHREVINRLFSQVSFKVIQNTGHWLHAEKPMLFNQLAKDFLLEKKSDK